MICRTLGQHYRCNASRFDVHLPKTGTLCRAGSVDCSLVVVDTGLYCIEPSADITETHQTQQGRHPIRRYCMLLFFYVLRSLKKIVSDMLSF